MTTLDGIKQLLGKARFTQARIGSTTTKTGLLTAPKLDRTGSRQMAKCKDTGADVWQQAKGLFLARRIVLACSMKQAVALAAFAEPAGLSKLQGR